MSNYIDSGFNNNLLREVTLNAFEYNPVQTEALLSEMDGNKITTTLPGNIVGQGISADNITTGEMLFDRARGGTLQLGGEGNKDGVFSLKDENDTDKISMSKDGMTINEGAMTIKNKNNQAVLDETGLVSTTNFKSGEVVTTSAQAITSATFTDITGLGLNINLPRPAKVLLLASLTGHHQEYDGALSFQYVVDGTALPEKAVIAGIQAYGALAVTPPDVGITISMINLVELSTGVHYAKIQARNNNANAYADVLYNANYGGSNTFVYIILGS